MAFQKKRFDKEAQESGKWFDYDGAKFKLASAKKKEFLKAYAEAAGEDGNIKEDADLHKVLLTVILDWENVADEDGVTPLEFNEKDLLEILEDDDEFARWALSTVLNQENYRREKVEAKAKK